MVSQEIIFNCEKGVDVMRDAGDYGSDLLRDFENLACFVKK